MFSTMNRKELTELVEKSQWKKGSNAPADLQLYAARFEPRLGQSIYTIIHFDGEVILLCWDNPSNGKFQYFVLPKINYSGF